MVNQSAIISPASVDIKVNIQVNDDRTVKIWTEKTTMTFNMDVDSYPMRGPLFYHIKELCNGNRYQMQKIFFILNKYRGHWDKYVLF